MHARSKPDTQLAVRAVIAAARVERDQAQRAGDRNERTPATPTRPIPARRIKTAGGP